MDSSLLDTGLEDRDAMFQKLLLNAAVGKCFSELKKQSPPDISKLKFIPNC